VISIVTLDDRRSLLTELLLQSYHKSLVVEQLLHTRHVDDFDRPIPMTGGMGIPSSQDTSTVTISLSNTYSTGGNDGWAGFAGTNCWCNGFDYLSEQAAIEKAWKRRWQDYHSMRDETPYRYSKKSAPKSLVKNGFLRIPGLLAQRKSPFSPVMRAHANFMKNVVKSYRRSIRNVV